MLEDCPDLWSSPHDFSGRLAFSQLELLSLNGSPGLAKLFHDCITAPKVLTALCTAYCGPLHLAIFWSVRC